MDLSTKQNNKEFETNKLPVSAWAPLEPVNQKKVRRVVQKENHWTQQKELFWNRPSIDGAVPSELVLNHRAGKSEELKI